MCGCRQGTLNTADEPVDDHFFFAIGARPCAHRVACLCAVGANRPPGASLSLPSRDGRDGRGKEDWVLSLARVIYRQTRSTPLSAGRGTSSGLPPVRVFFFYGVDARPPAGPPRRAPPAPLAVEDEERSRGGCGMDQRARNETQTTERKQRGAGLPQSVPAAVGACA